jgi:outer membrane protein, multidrug efflux system
MDKTDVVGQAPLIATAVASALLLSGCIVSRVDPEKPELPLPAALPAQSQAIAQLPTPWWSVFSDPTLDQLMDEALMNNPDVTIAAARVAEARAGLRIVDSDRYPSVDLEMDATRSRESLAVTQFEDMDQPRTIYTVRGVVGYEVDLWGRYARASESARAQLLNTEYGREASKLSLTGEVARGYFGLLAAAEQLARSRDTLSTREESVRLERLRLDAGESDEFTFKRAEAEAASTRKSVFQLELEVVERTNALGLLLGRSPKDLVDSAISVQGASLPSPAVLPAALPSAVLQRRPDVGAAEAALNASAADIGVARALIFPSISLTGTLGSASSQLRDLFTSGNDAWSAAAGLLQPIFQGGNWRANVERTKAIREQRKAEYARTVQTAFRDVLDALQGQSLIASVREANAAQVDALARATQLAELRYNQGDIDYLDLLDVRRSLYQAQIDLLATQRDALVNAVDLALAVGGSLGDKAEPLSARR